MFDVVAVVAVGVEFVVADAGVDDCYCWRRLGLLFDRLLVVVVAAEFAAVAGVVAAAAGVVAAAGVAAGCYLVVAAFVQFLKLSLRLFLFFSSHKSSGSCLIYSLSSPLKTII